MQSSLAVVLNLGKRLSQCVLPCIDEAHCGFTQGDWKLVFKIKETS